MKIQEIETTKQLDAHLETGQKLNNIVFQSVDLSEYTLNLLSEPLQNCIFLGCKIDPGIIDEIIYKGALVFPPLDNLPYKAFRNSLYSPEELTEGLDPGNKESIDQMFDSIVFEHFVKTGRSNPPSIHESFARRLHDHSITDSLDEFLIDKNVVAIMGGIQKKEMKKSF